MTMQEALQADNSAEIDWGYLAGTLLTPYFQSVYETTRLPHWERYQAEAKKAEKLHWTAAEHVMPQVWQEYRRSVARAFKFAASKQILAENIAKLEAQYA